jgi:hypothetical protein
MDCLNLCSLFTSFAPQWQLLYWVLIQVRAEVSYLLPLKQDYYFVNFVYFGPRLSQYLMWCLSATGRCSKSIHGGVFDFHLEVPFSSKFHQQKMKKAMALDQVENLPSESLTSLVLPSLLVRRLTLQVGAVSYPTTSFFHLLCPQFVFACHPLVFILQLDSWILPFTHLPDKQSWS